MFSRAHGLRLVNFGISARPLSGGVEDTGECISQREVWDTDVYREVVISQLVKGVQRNEVLRGVSVLRRVDV